MMKILLFLVGLFVPGVYSGKDRILLDNLKVITLEDGRLTNARRTSPIPQLRCVGGSAGCSAFKPKVVQCINQGSDGYDAQWECKADMSNRYRFGRIQVNCEGYDYPNDPYVLRGSCGLEYTLDLTKEGHRKKSSGGLWGSSKQGRGAGILGNLLPIAIICVVIYFVYKTCLAPSSAHDTEGVNPPPYPGHPYERPPPPYPGTPSGGPPPPGFRPEYTPGGECDDDVRYRASAPPAYEHHEQQQGSSAGGFWSGAALGGLAGYLFGSSGQRSGPSYYSDNCGSSYGSSSRLYPDLGGYGGSSRHSSSGSSSSSGGSRVTSGFGGTSRR